MRGIALGGRRGGAAAPAFLVGAIALVAVLVFENWGLQPILPLVACVAVLAGWTRQLTRWRNLLAGLLLVILFIPIKRYNLPGNLPFQLEPYRIVVAGLALLWVLAMLADPAVRLRRTRLDAPLLMILLTAFLSDLVNLSRVRQISSDVLKGQTFFVSFFVVLYLVVSLVRSRRDLTFIVQLLGAGGGVIAASAIIERRTGYNIFDHLHRLFPILHFEGSGEQFRDGRLRVLASSQHPIALSVLFVLLLPLAIYLARRDRRWLVVSMIYVVAIFTTASRTGIIGLLVLLIFYLILQPRSVLRAWPLLIPLLVIVHIAAPGAIGTVRATMTPSGMIAEQSAVTVGDDAYASGRLTDIGPSLSEWSRKPLLGEGFSTRIPTGPNANARLLDDQWLGTLLETGYFGFLAWVWLFVRSVRRLARAAIREGDTDEGWLLTGFAASIAAFAVTMFFYDTFSFVQNVFMAFILLGVSAAYLEIRETEGGRSTSVAPASAG